MVAACKRVLDDFGYIQITVERAVTPQRGIVHAAGYLK